MRRVRIAWIAAAALAGCSLAHDEYPSRACARDDDCFSQRETCNQLTRECEPLPDAALPDAASAADAAAGADAGTADAALDAGT